MENPPISPSPEPIIQPENIQVSVTPEPNKSKKNLYATLAVACLVIVVGAVAYLAGMNSAKSKEKTANAQPENVNTTFPSVTASPTSIPITQKSDPTDTWNVYSNIKYKFTFRYPQPLEKTTAVSGGPIGGKPTLIATFADPKTLIPHSDASFDGFSVYVVSQSNIGQLSSDEYVAEEKKQFDQRPRTMMGGAVQREFKVNGLQVIALHVEDDIELFYVLAPENIIVFSRVKANDSFIPTFEQILGTFTVTAKSAGSASDEAQIVDALFKKNNWGEDFRNTFQITISTNDGKYASGGGGGGYLFAEKVNGKWEIVADGNGVITCESLTKYPDFPKNLIPECFDEAARKPVQR